MTQKKTKIIATIGPASKDADMLAQMIQQGMSVARLNFSHGSYASHAQLISHSRLAAKRANY